MEIYFDRYLTFLEIYNITENEVSFFKWLRLQSPNVAMSYYRQRQTKIKRMGVNLFSEKEKKELQDIDAMVKDAKEVKELYEQSERERKLKNKTR
jgi:hypothetical protein